jgi:hypothetical protein
VQYADQVSDPDPQVVAITPWPHCMATDAVELIGECVRLRPIFPAGQR